MYKDIDEAIKQLTENYNFWMQFACDDCLEEGEHKVNNCEENANSCYQIIRWLEELKKLRELKDTYAKGMETSYSEFRYKQGKAEGYSKAENDYFAQSKKDREDTYNCGYAIGRADAEAEQKAMCESCIHKVSADDIKAIRNSAIDETIAYFEIHAHEVYNHVSARDFICDRLEQLKESKDV